MPAAVYVHWAFCPYVCPYCDFAKWAWDDASAARYLRALEAEIEHAPRLEASSVFYGGGTPNAYPPAALVAVLDRLRARLDLRDDAEITLEANPDAGERDDLAVLRAAGFNRLSIGVQSFDPDELRALGRRHRAEDVRRMIDAARAAGFTNVSIDLMVGVPHQTLASLDRTLDRTLELEVEHVSAYGLAVEPDTPFERWREREPGAFPDDDLGADLYARAIERLTAAGYEQYEISNFARPGFRSEHNRTYWRNGEYLGFGVGAASYRDGVRSTHTRDRAAYETAALAGLPIPGESERLTGDARLGEAIMLALRTAEGVDTNAFRERYGVDVLARFAPVIAELAADGLLERDAAGVRLTPRGRFVANDVCGAFIAGA